MLAAGELDALVSPRMPSTFTLDGTADVRRLYDDPWAAARDYYARTKLFWIMHLLVVRRHIVEANPWVPATLLAAFTAAKRLAEADLYDPTALRTQMPSLLESYEQTVRAMAHQRTHKLRACARVRTRAAQLAGKRGLATRLPARARSADRSHTRASLETFRRNR